MVNVRVAKKSEKVTFENFYPFKVQKFASAGPETDLSVLGKVMTSNRIRRATQNVNRQQQTN